MASVCNMTLVEQQHLALLRMSLSKDAEVDCCLTEHPIDWEQLRMYAETQCTLGLISNAIERLPQFLWPVRKVRLEWSALGYQMSLQNEEVNVALADLVKLFVEEKITYAVVKGQTLAALYPCPQLRQCGDVDFYVASCDFFRAKDLIQRRLGVDVIGDEQEDKHDTFDYREVRFEMHYRLETFGTKAHQRRFDEMIDRCFSKQAYYRQIGDVNVRILPPVEEIVLTFKHLFNHLLMEGVGLRQCCDMFVLLQTFDNNNKNHLKEQLSSIGYYHAFLAFGAMIVKYLELPEHAFPFPLSSSDFRWSDSLLRVVLEHGNFGKHNRLSCNFALIHKMDTARVSLSHCIRFLPLASNDILGLVPRRLAIAFRNRLLL